MKIKIRKTKSEDRKAIKTILIDTQIFNQEEIECALELIDIYLNNPSQKDYLITSAINEDDKIIGYVCYGKAPLTNGAYDLYWIAVKPEY